MKKLCTWCKQDMNAAPLDITPEPPLTHNICNRCVDRLLDQHREKMEEFIDTFGEPVIATDGTMRVLFANNPARKSSPKESTDSKEFLVGDLIECGFALFPEGCGKSIHCDGCAIRKTIIDTHATGKGRLKQPAYLIRSTPLNRHAIQYLISTEKVRDVVLMRIDQAEYAEELPTKTLPANTKRSD